MTSSSTYKIVSYCVTICMLKNPVYRSSMCRRAFMRPISRALSSTWYLFQASKASRWIIRSCRAIQPWQGPSRPLRKMVLLAKINCGDDVFCVNDRILTLLHTIDLYPWHPHAPTAFRLLPASAWHFPQSQWCGWCSICKVYPDPERNAAEDVQSGTKVLLDTHITSTVSRKL